MIKVQNLTKYYNDFFAVKGINFSIPKGQIVGLLGPNGAGKSTTIRILCGYLQPTSGNVLINGLSVKDFPTQVKDQIGYLPESAPLYQDMIVFDYLNYIAETRQIPKRQIPKRLKEMVELCRIGDVMHKNIGELSKGYRQRVGLAHAIIGDPKILVLDEPTSGLDPNQIIEIRKTIKHIGQQKTVLLSSHILSEVEATCDRVIIINKGKVVADGTAAEIKASTSSSKKVLVEFPHSFADHQAKLLNDAKSAFHQLDFVKNIAIQLPAPENSYALPGLLIHHNAKEEIRNQLYNLIKTQNWPLLTFHETAESFESVFRELTTQSVASPPIPPADIPPTEKETHKVSNPDPSN